MITITLFIRYLLFIYVMLVSDFFLIKFFRLYLFIPRPQLFPRITIVVKDNYRASHILRQVTLSSGEKQSSCDSSCDSARGVELELSGQTVPTRCLISTRKQKERVLQRKKN
jgi:hypothetical protein